MALLLTFSMQLYNENLKALVFFYLKKHHYVFPLRLLPFEQYNLKEESFINVQHKHALSLILWHGIRCKKNTNVNRHGTNIHSTLSHNIQVFQDISFQNDECSFIGKRSDSR